MALALPLEPARELAARLRGALGPAASDDLRFTPPEGMHLTLLFLGAVAAEREAALERELGAGLAGARAPELVVGRPGTFPARGPVRVLWAAAEEGEGSGALDELRGRVLAAAARAGFDVAAERERPFHPHVTVARVRSVRGSRRPREWSSPAGLAERVERWSWTPSEVRLVESVPARTGPPRYERRAGWPLGSGGGRAEAAPHP